MITYDGYLTLKKRATRLCMRTEDGRGKGKRILWFRQGMRRGEKEREEREVDAGPCNQVFCAAFDLAKNVSDHYFIGRLADETVGQVTPVLE
jgi:hypothetical protein